MVDMVGNLEKARGEGVGEAERARCLDSILAEAGSMRSGREAEAAAKILARVRNTCKLCGKLKQNGIVWKDVIASVVGSINFILQGSNKPPYLTRYVRPCIKFWLSKQCWCNGVWKFITCHFGR